MGRSIGEAGDGATALAIIDKLHPDIVLLGVRMPEMSGFEVVRHLRRTATTPAAGFTTAHDKFPPFWKLADKKIVATERRPRKFGVLSHRDSVRGSVHLRATQQY